MKGLRIMSFFLAACVLAGPAGRSSGHGARRRKIRSRTSSNKSWRLSIPW